LKKNYLKLIEKNMYLALRTLTYPVGI